MANRTPRRMHTRTTGVRYYTRVPEHDGPFASPFPPTGRPPGKSNSPRGSPHCPVDSLFCPRAGFQRTRREHVPPRSGATTIARIRTGGNTTVRAATTDTGDTGVRFRRTRRFLYDSVKRLVKRQKAQVQFVRSNSESWMLPAVDARVVSKSLKPLGCRLKKQKQKGVFVEKPVVF